MKKQIKKLLTDNDTTIKNHNVSLTEQEQKTLQVLQEKEEAFHTKDQNYEQLKIDKASKISDLESQLYEMKTKNEKLQTDKDSNSKEHNDALVN